LLLACSQRKRLDAGVLPAIDRYDGPAFRLLRRYIKQNSVQSVDAKIISAEYGLISTDYSLPYYDCRITKKQSKILHSQVITGLEIALNSKPYTNLLIWLGRDYLEAIHSYEAIIPEGMTVQLANGGIGRRLSILYDWLYGDLSSLQYKQVPTLPKSTVFIRGIEVSLTPDQILNVARQAISLGKRGATQYQSWYVRVDDQRVAPKWLVSQITGLSVSTFHTDSARKTLQKLGIPVYFDRVN
jgi:hypothetical protein